MKNQNVFENKICFVVVEKKNELIIKIQNFANLDSSKIYTGCY